MLHLTAAVLSFAATFVFPTDPKLPAKTDDKARAIAVLEQWEKQVEKTNSFIAKDVVRTDKERGQTKTWKGELRYIRPNYVALRLVLQEDPKLYEMFVQNGKMLYEYRTLANKLVIHELPSKSFDVLDFGRGSILGNRSWWNLLVKKEPSKSASFHDDLAEFKACCDVTVTRDLSTENPHYIYVLATPKCTKGMREFVQLQLVFHASTMNLRRLWIAQTIGTEVTWDFPNFDTKTKITPADLVAPPAPEGWTTESLPLLKLDQTGQ